MSTVIGIGGKLRSGKDTVADRLVEDHGFVKTSMGEVLLSHMLAVDPWIKVRITEAYRLGLDASVQVRRASQLVAILGYTEAKTIADFRDYMQKDGTEGGRDLLGEDVWVNLMARQINEHLLEGRSVVVTGVRFPNELAMVRSFAGRAWWVERPDLAETSAATHASERGVDPIDFDTYISNGGTLDDLYEMVDTLAVRL